MPTLGVSVTTDYRTAPNNALVTGQNITIIQFSNAALATALFDSAQFGGANISNTVLLRGNAADNLVDVSMSATGSFSAAGWTFSAWGFGSDLINLTGSSGNDSITGASQSTALYGRGGNDTLVGGAGFDTLDGGTGADSMTGGGGNDVYYVDNVGDVIVEVADTVAGGVDSAYTSVSFTQWTGVEYIYATGAAPLTGTGNNGFSAMAASSRQAGLTFFGLGGDDILAGSNFADSLDGGADNDSITGAAGNDTLIGGLGLDTLIGGDGDDEMRGGDGEDVFVYNASSEIGLDTLDGAGALNTLRLTFDGTADFRQATIASVGMTSIDRLTTVGAAGVNVFFTSAQFGATGINNTLRVDSAGADSLNVDVSGALDLRLLTFVGWDSNDGIVLRALASSTITGTTQTDQIIGSDGSDTLDGLSGDDFIFGGLGADRLVGGGGDDRFVVSSTADITGDTIDGGAVGAGLTGDLLDVSGTGLFDLTGATFQSSGTTSIETLQFSSSVFVTQALEIVLNGAQFGSTALSTSLKVVGRSGGGFGNGNAVDTLTINNISGFFDAGGFSLINWDITGDRIALTATSAQANIIGGTVQADYITGGNVSNTLSGNLGADTIIGGTGNDTIDGGAGADSMTGGDGVDTLSYASSTSGAGILFYMLAPNLNGGDAAGDIYGLFENVAGTSVNDRIYMDNNDNRVQGGGGFDTVELYGGNDSYAGGSGFDYVLGGAGIDLITVGDGGSLIYGEDGDDAITATAGSNEFNGGLGNDTLTGGTGQDVILGGAGLDSIIGGSGGDFLFGEDGDDTISGDAGNDQIQGGIGLDSISGGANVDVIQGGADNDSIDGGSEDDFLFGEAGNDTVLGGTGNDQVFGGSENDSLVGNAGIDILNGGDGSDTLNDGGTGELTFSIGGNGNDTIFGTSGQDQMWGGTGSVDVGRDTFVFGAGNGYDIIFDFQGGIGLVDQIRLVGTGITSFAQLQAENRIGQAGANTQINLPGAGNVIFLINTTASSLVADDFLFA